MNLGEINGYDVRLRAYRPDDAEAVAAGYDDPAAYRFLAPLPSPFTLAHAQRYLADGVASVYAQGGAVYAIADPDTDALLGGIGFDQVTVARGQAEIGYWVGPWARRRGVATAAVRALSEHALAAGLGRLEILTHWENTPSQRVALSAGYRREGVRRAALPNRDGGRDDLIAFARVAGDSGEPDARLLPDLPGGELTDGVVTLRPLGPGDLEIYTELHSLPEVVETSVPPVAPSRTALHQRCLRAAAHWLAGSRAELLVVDATSGTPAGELALFYQEPLTNQAMIGYSMLPAFRGRGWMTRAVQLLSLWAFAETDVARLIAGTAPTNAASQRVLTKAGFRREAYLRARLPGPGGHRSDDLQFVLLPEDLLGDGPAVNA